MSSMTAPRRIQRRRTKGWRMPERAVYVGRGSKWGNPYRVEDGISTWGAVWRYRDILTRVLPAPDGFPTVEDVRRELAGRDLACWCPLDAPCHGDVLLDLANPHEWGANPGDGCVRCAGLPGDGPCEVTP